MPTTFVPPGPVGPPARGLTPGEGRYPGSQPSLPPGEFRPAVFPSESLFPGTDLYPSEGSRTEPVVRTATCTLIGNGQMSAARGASVFNWKAEMVGAGVFSAVGVQAGASAAKDRIPGRVFLRSESARQITLASEQARRVGLRSELPVRIEL